MADADDKQNEETGIPGVRSWWGVYGLVLAVFALIVVALTIFTQAFK